MSARRAGTAAAALLAAAAAVVPQPATASGGKDASPPSTNPFFNPQRYHCGRYVDETGYALVGAIPLYTKTTVERVLAHDSRVALVVRERCEPMLTPWTPGDGPEGLGTDLLFDLVAVNGIALCSAQLMLDPDHKTKLTLGIQEAVVRTIVPGLSFLYDGLRASGMDPKKARAEYDRLVALWRKGVTARTGVQMPCRIEVGAVRTPPLRKSLKDSFIVEVDLRLVGVPPRPRPGVPGLGPDGRMTILALLQRPLKIEHEPGKWSAVPPELPAGKRNNPRLWVLHPKSAQLREDGYRQAK